MNLIERIKADQKFGTPGPWRFVTVTTSCGVCHKVGEWPSNGAHKVSSACLYEDYPPTTLGLPTETATNASRISRVPEMEAALLASEGLANWCDALIEMVQATSCAPDDPEAFSEVLMGAQQFLASFREACK